MTSSAPASSAATTDSSSTTDEETISTRTAIASRNAAHRRTTSKRASSRSTTIASGRIALTRSTSVRVTATSITSYVALASASPRTGPAGADVVQHRHLRTVVRVRAIVTASVCCGLPTVAMPRSVGASCIDRVAAVFPSGFARAQPCVDRAESPSGRNNPATAAKREVPMVDTGSRQRRRAVIPLEHSRGGPSLRRAVKYIIGGAIGAVVPAVLIVGEAYADTGDDALAAVTSLGARPPTCCGSSSAPSW